ncbi:hypothetical protein OEZ86_006746 [Tetradesmus obliquus]|nr:hypothetical protein OEZ86_006746 [Tetradesmus obliquus]
MDDNDDVLQDPCLPQDALRSVFSYLDCHSLCSCSCVCRSWRTLAVEDGLWQVQLSQQFYRPAMLQHYSMLASHHHQLQQARQLESTCSQAQQAVKDEPACMAAAAPARLKQVFKNSALQPSCKHQALLARFHTAMASITAWRLMVQQQEQSCWVRFNLPAALKQDSKVAEAADKELLEGAVQALGPCGWFDVACAAPFAIADDDMEILLQSHKTGFYAWDQAEEDGLLGRDEFMVDFALFDGSGTLLMGRAGVEVWAKELVSWHTREPCIVLPPNAQQGDAAVAAQAAAQAAQAAAPGAAAAGSSVRHERTVHMLHFLVDGVDGSLWENGLMVDAEPAPAGVTQPPLLKLNLTWAALHGLYGTKQQQQVDGTAEQDSAYQVGDAMQEMMAALGGG